MTQNIYDDPDFFSGYSQLQRSIRGLDGAPEWPTLRAMLPDLTGARVLDLGCGYGWFCRWAVEQGAVSVVGVDVSERMLARAVELTDERAPIDYRREDLDAHAPRSAAFDLAYSSLALHYVADVRRLVTAVRHGLADDGAFVFNVEHPIRTAPTQPAFDVSDDGVRRWPLDHYLVEGPRTLDWITAGVVKHHRTISTYLTVLLEAGFTIDHVEEWCPTAEQLTEHPSWADEMHRPSFLVVAASV